MTTPFSPSDLAAIEAAVREAETRTQGEIYCVVAEDSSDYDAVPLTWAAGVALLAPAILLLAGIRLRITELFGHPWLAAQISQSAETAARAALLEAVILQGLLFLATWALVSIPAVKVALTPRPLKRERVRRRAAEQFLAKNLHATRERTGVLMYVSLAERLAELIADEGINTKVEANVWDKAMAALTEGLKRGEPAAGFAAAVGLCGDVLAEHFPPRPDNPNELPDLVVVLPRT